MNQICFQISKLSRNYSSAEFTCIGENTGDSNHQITNAVTLQLNCKLIRFWFVFILSGLSVLFKTLSHLKLIFPFEKISFLNSIALDEYNQHFYCEHWALLFKLQFMFSMAQRVNRKIIARIVLLPYFF